jgi:hypothetical protein
MAYRHFDHGESAQSYDRNERRYDYGSSPHDSEYSYRCEHGHYDRRSHYHDPLFETFERGRAASYDNNYRRAYGEASGDEAGKEEAQKGKAFSAAGGSK